MNTIIVHLERHNIVQHPLNVTHMGRGVSLNYETGESNTDTSEWHEWQSSNNYGNADVWYTNDMTYAELLAQKIAEQNPGRRVMIYSLNSVFQAPTSKPVKSVCTEKGLVPA